MSASARKSKGIMGKLRKAVLSADPANRGSYGCIEIRFELGAKAFKKEVEFASLDELGLKIASFAKDYGQGCAVFVRLPKGERKPAGFDAFCKTHQFHNLDAVAQQEAQ